MFLAALTTSYARLELFNLLDKLGRNVLYFDTDSVIFVEDSATPTIPLGNFLGELTNELPNDTHITHFASAGPKNYGYQLSTGENCCKVKGFQLNHRNSQFINYASMVEVIKDPTKQITLPPQKMIVRNKRKFTLENREEERRYSMVVTKRRRIDNFDSVPYGF